MSNRTTAPGAAKAALIFCLLAVPATIWWLTRSSEAPAVDAANPAAAEEQPVAQLPRTDFETAEEAAAADAKARQEAAAQIAAESSGTLAAPSAEAPPNFVPSATASRSPTPPDGYSFAAFHGDMAKAQSTDAQRDAGATPLPAWSYGNEVDALAAQAAAAGRDWTFGWVALAADAKATAVAQRVRELGGELLGPSAQLFRARLPGDARSLSRIADLPGVAGIAATPSSIKIPRSLAERAGALPQDETPVFVTLMAGDADGSWRQALADIGAVLGHYDSALRTVTANIPHAALAAIADADFVLAVQPIRRVWPSHDTSVPAMGADALRVYNESTGLFSGNGGSSVPIGVMDTGLNINHRDISTGRRSICGANLVPGFSAGSTRVQDQDLWIDAVGHGTHVTGTIAGNGTVRPRFAGIAPLVQDIRFAKVLGVAAPTTTLNIGRGMDFLSEPTSCDAAGTEAKALLVNMSLSLSGLDFDGRSFGERKLDATVWGSRQLYVVSAGNGRSRSRADYASAKNSLAVGASLDNGDIASFSSLGPTFDGRLLPQVVGTGVYLISALGQGSRSGYALSSGTSMSSPSVAGVAALLMDAEPQFKEQPAAVRARLMASAIKPDAFLADPRMFPLHNGDGPGTLQNQYGLGQVSARTSVLSRDGEDGWSSGAAVVEVGDAEYGYQDVVVPEGASRLDIVMTWDEPPSDTFARSVLNDLDLWVDRDVTCSPTEAACGNAASRSVVDNVEWLILRNPPAGTYRLKVVPKRALAPQARAALAWTIIRGPSTPQLAVAVDSAAVQADVGERFTVEATVTVDGYVAAGTTLRMACRGEAGSSACQQVELLAPRASSIHREDNISRSFSDESSEEVVLGEVGAGEEQKVTLAFDRMPAADRFRLYLIAEAWNASSAMASVEVSIGDSEIPLPALASAPANDAFGDAARLLNKVGSASFDMLLATKEPAEPTFTRGEINEYGRDQQAVRPRSLWYAWTPPASDLYRISVAGGVPGDIADHLQIDLFAVEENDALVSLQSYSTKTGGGVTFDATRRQAHRIRLSYVAETSFEYNQELLPFFSPAVLTPLARRTVQPLRMHWAPASLPENDDFGLAAELSGEEGAVSGSNLGGTVQEGEFLHSLTATSWHRWTAPADGDWQFAVDRGQLRVAVFSGDDVADLRLLSGQPGTAATVPVRKGVEYRILVAAKDAEVSGSDYTLTWVPTGRPFGSNDDIANAETLPGLPTSFHFTGADFVNATVEPGEPPQTGSRTAWWSWQAPAAGHYTWSLDTTQPFRLVAFGGGVDALQLLAMSDSFDPAPKVSFPAMEGETYWLAVGLPSEAALDTVQAFINFIWGTTPANDDFASAAVLMGASGTIAGSNAFATTEGAEQVAGAGDASLWWTWQAPADGWYRFALLGDPAARLVIYEGADSIDHLREIGRSHRLENATDAVFQAKAGVGYAIRLGTRATGAAGAFEISWSADSPPAWHRYLGAVISGSVDADGNVVEIFGPSAIAMNAEGSELYLASQQGLQVYQRDAKDGGLVFLQSFADVYGNAGLLWDATSNSLLVAACGGWQRFAAVEKGAGLTPAVGLTGDGVCPGISMFTDPDGSFVYSVRPDGRIDIVGLNAKRSAIEVVASTPIAGLTAAAINHSGTHVYVAAQDPTSGDMLLVFQRNADDGMLQAPTTGWAVEDLQAVSALATDPKDRFLFAFGRDGTEPFAFDLSEAEMPSLLASLPSFVTSNRWWAVNRCTFADVRTETASVDVFCSDSVYSVRLLPEAPALRAEDNLTTGGTDGFGNFVPPHVMTGAVVKSPDGKHFYAASEDGIVIIERVGSR